MGPEAIAAFEAAAPYIFAGGTAASMIGQDEQARQQRNIINRAALKSEEDQNKGATQAIDEAQTMQAGEREQAMQAEQQAAFERAQADVGGAGGATVDAPANGGSAAYMRLKGERDATEGDRLTAVARELSKLRGVTSTQQAEATRRSALAEKLGSMWSSGRQRTQAAGLDASSVDMPGYGQIGQIAQLVGGAGMMSGAGAAGTVGSASTAVPAMAEMSTAGTAMTSAPATTSLWSSPGIWGQAAALTARKRNNSMFAWGQ